MLPITTVKGMPLKMVGSYVKWGSRHYSVVVSGRGVGDDDVVFLQEILRIKEALAVDIIRSLNSRILTAEMVCETLNISA